MEKIQGEAKKVLERVNERWINRKENLVGKLTRGVKRGHHYIGRN